MGRSALSAHTAYAADGGGCCCGHASLVLAVAPPITRKSSSVMARCVLQSWHLGFAAALAAAWLRLARCRLPS